MEGHKIRNVTIWLQLAGMELNSGDTRLLVEKLETGDVAGPDIGFGDYEPESAWHDNL